ncbi:MAG: prepilin-type N-terminal cleavage/methylation domain-containing protein [Desulfitobacteriaceae bacterium]
MKVQRGFTLLEVLLVLTILGGAGFALAVKLPLDFQVQRLNLTSTQLLSDLRDARQAAMAENTWYQVKFFTYERTYRILRQGTKVKDVPLPEGIKFLNTPQDLTFNAVGNPIPGMTISLVNQKGQKRNVIVAPVAGRIREE